MFSGIKSRLAKNGYFLMSCCVFEPDREDPETQIVDNAIEKIYTCFDQCSFPTLHLLPQYLRRKLKKWVFFAKNAIFFQKCNFSTPNFRL